MYEMHACVCALHSASLKPGFTSREIVILENDDPGGVFEFSAISRGPWTINVRLTSKSLLQMQTSIDTYFKDISFSKGVYC